MTTGTIKSMAKVVEIFGYKVIPTKKSKSSIADELLGKFEIKGENISTDVKKLRESGYEK